MSGFTRNPYWYGDVLVRQPTGARARIVGLIDSVPLAAGGDALHLVIVDAAVEALPAKG